MPGMMFSKRLTCVCQETDQTRDDNPLITGPDDPESVNLQVAYTRQNTEQRAMVRQGGRTTKASPMTVCAM